MGFWIFMLLADTLLPVVMICFGKLFQKFPPKTINPVFGYRTKMSMKNRDTWQFAHQYCGKVWRLCGVILLPLSMIPMFFVMGQNEEIVGILGSILWVVQLIPLTGSVFFTERALKKTFDENGCRR